MLRYTGSTSIDYPALFASEIDSEVATPSPRRSEFPRESCRFFPASSPVRSGLANPLVNKLQNFAHLDETDVLALDALLAFPKALRARQILVHENSALDHIYLLVQGMACRYKLLPGGNRQILGYLLPGDFCDIHFVTHNRPDHSVALLSDSQVIRIPAQKICSLLTGFPHIERALSLAALHDIAILREWLLNVGQRNALQKLSHFFCEMKLRLERVGQVDEDGSFELPINQMALADTTGLTPVHINRTLQRLRSDGLIRLYQRRLFIIDTDRLAAIAGFEDSYLQINQCMR